MDLRHNVLLVALFHVIGFEHCKAFNALESMLIVLVRAFLLKSLVERKLKTSQCPKLPIIFP